VVNCHVLNVLSVERLRITSGALVAPWIACRLVHALLACVTTQSFRASMMALSEILLRGNAPSMVAELLPIDSFRTKAVHFPRLAQFATRSPVPRSAALVVHSRLLLLLALPPGGEVPRAVQERHNQHPGLGDLVLQSIFMDEDVPNGRVVQPGSRRRSAPHPEPARRLS
jgi:hypothetical protein